MSSYPDDDLKRAIGCLENCDCAECRERWRQGRSLASQEASLYTVGWTVALLALGVVAAVGWILLLT